MAMSPALVDREQGKFRDAGSPGQTRVAVDVEAGSISASSGFSTVGSGMPANVSVSTSSTLVLAANANRKYAHVANHSNKTVFLQFGASAVLSEGIRLSPGSVWVLSGGDLWLGVVNAIVSTGTASVSVTDLET